MQQLEFSQEELAAIKTELCKGATDEQFTLFIEECKRRRLVPGTHLFFQLRGAKEYDPVLKVKVAVKKATWITKIDAMRLIAQRTGEYQGQEPPLLIYLDDAGKPTLVSDVPLPDPANPRLPREPWAARVSVHRKGFVRPFTATCRFDAYAVTYSTDKGSVLSEMWARRGDAQIIKCAEVAALKGAFPEELGSLYVSEEFENQAEPEIDTPPPAPLAAAPTAPVVPTVNHTPAVISNEPRPGELVQIANVGQAPPALGTVLSEALGNNTPATKKRAKKPTIEELPVAPANPEFVATDDDLPAIMFEGPENAADPYKALAEAATNRKPAEGERSTTMPAALGAPYGDNVQKMDKPEPLSGKEIGDKVRGYYDLASQSEISKHILGTTGAKSSKDVTQEQWRNIFAAFDTAKAEGKEAFQKLVKGA